MTCLREEREKLEHLLIGPYGVLAENSRGRLMPEEPCPIRTCFQTSKFFIIRTEIFLLFVSSLTVKYMLRHKVNVLSV